jgi:hypothetical protein
MHRTTFARRSLSARREFITEGILFVRDLPDGTREQIRALRDELVPAMEAGPPVQPVFDAKVGDLARLAARRQ